MVFFEVVVYDACDVDEVDVGGVKLKDLVRDVGVVDDVCHVDEDFVGDASDEWEEINDVSAIKLIGGVV